MVKYDGESRTMVKMIPDMGGFVGMVGPNDEGTGGRPHMNEAHKKGAPIEQASCSIPAVDESVDDRQCPSKVEEGPGDIDASQQPLEDDLEEIIVSESMAHLFPAYLARVAEMTVEIEKHLRARDLGSIFIIGHNLKGTGGTYGFDPLSKLGEQIELAAQAGDTDQIKALADCLIVWLNRARWKVVG
jgi:HPt (histidine-containing phosphotransfer) domain-containing protein